MRVESNKDERICYNIQDVIVTNPKEHLEHLLFAHAFSGCDATLQIHNFGKKSIFGKLKKSSGLQEIFKKFQQCDYSIFLIALFTFFYTPENKETKYDAIVVSDRSKIDPALFTPSPRAAFYHGVRVYHQEAVWKDLSEVDKDPLHWGWKLSSNKYVPIMTDAQAGPSELLKIIRCGCNGSCGAKCSCRKASLKCTSTFKECHAIICTNIPDIEPEENQINLQKRFLDAFEIYQYTVIKFETN